MRRPIHSLTCLAFVCLAFALCGCNSALGTKTTSTSGKDAGSVITPLPEPPADADAAAAIKTSDAGPDSGRDAAPDAVADIALGRQDAAPDAAADIAGGRGDAAPDAVADIAGAADVVEVRGPEVPLLATDADSSRRLPLPCTAPLPTGFCLVSDPGDYIGGGRTHSGSGKASVSTYMGATPTFVSFQLADTSTSGQWEIDFEAPAGTTLVPGLFDRAERWPFEEGTAAGLSIDGNGAGCNTLSGRFSIEELERDPNNGLVRFSATFEQHCDDATPALRGVVNYQATGTADPTPTADQVVNLSGKIFRVVYDATANVAYGLDATNRKLAKIDLTSGNVIYENVIQVPNDACVDAKRSRLFVVNKGSALITEYDTSNLKAVRDIAWTGTDWGPQSTAFKIYCAPNQLYVVDGAWAPGLFTVEGLDSSNPTAIDHTSIISGVGGLALNSTVTDLYYWYQYGWDAGLLSTYVARATTADLNQIDKSATNLASFSRDPVDAPLLLDETRGLIFVKNKIFDATNLSKVVYTLPGSSDTSGGAAENAYAIAPAQGLLSTKNFVYDLARYDVLAATLVPQADQMFFDSSGTLWLLSIADGQLKAQKINR